MGKLIVCIDSRRFEIELSPTLCGQLRSDVSATRQYPASYSILVDGTPVEVVIPELENPVEGVQCLIVNDRPIETTIDPNMRWIKSPWGVHTLEIRDLDTNMTPLHNGNGFHSNGKTSHGMTSHAMTSNGQIRAPIPGLIIQVKISIGESVEAGHPMFILEAMKMENEIRAPRSGIIKSINVSPGQGVALDQVLAEID